MPRKDPLAGNLSAQVQQDIISEGIDNFELPKSVVMKIAKSALPDNVKLQKETVLSLVKGSTVFINYLAAMAHDVALSKQHKSISASDVLKALENIEFGDMANQLQDELKIYKDLNKNEKGKKGSSSASRKASSASAPVKGKGKEKAVPSNGIAPPFTSAPLGGLPASASAHVAPPPEAPMLVDEEEADVEVRQVEDDEPELDEEAEGAEDEIIESDEDQSEEELEDRDALEEEELRKDARGVKERGAMSYDDDD
ncbi:histone-fold-containing protein [Agrocybe pediades]|nr:histone-fold-containing protein [Agrocybe pediades]